MTRQWAVRGLRLHRGSKTGAPTKFSNNFNKYWPILVIFCTENLQTVSKFTFVACEFLIKRGTS